jgi:hypothetical protein
VGAYAVEIIEKSFSAREKMAFKKNLINFAESCEKTATAISLKMADAVIGWRVFPYWDPAAPDHSSRKGGSPSGGIYSHSRFQIRLRLAFRSASAGLI